MQALLREDTAAQIWCHIDGLDQLTGRGEGGDESSERRSVQGIDSIQIRIQCLSADWKEGAWKNLSSSILFEQGSVPL